MVQSMRLPQRTRPRRAGALVRTGEPVPDCARTPATTRICLEIIRGQPSLAGDLRQHDRADLGVIVKGEDIFRPARAPQRAMRTALPFETPPDPQQGAINPAGWGR